MKDKKDSFNANNKAVDRRKFFRSAGLGAIGASASMIPLLGTASSETEIKSRRKTSGKYHLTDHVKQAYRLARF